MADIHPSAVTVPDAHCPLVERHRGWLSRLIAARAGSREVDDVLQEVALAVARSERPPSAAEEERPWLCMIAIRQCALALRKATRRARLVSRAAEHVAPPSRIGDDPVYWLISCETRSLVRTAFAALSAAQQEMLMWKYVEGLTYPEIAARLGVSRHVAEYQVVLAKRALREAFMETSMGEEGER